MDPISALVHAAGFWAIVVPMLVALAVRHLWGKGSGDWGFILKCGLVIFGAMLLYFSFRAWSYWGWGPLTVLAWLAAALLVGWFVLELAFVLGKALVDVTKANAKYVIIALVVVLVVFAIIEANATGPLWQIGSAIVQVWLVVIIFGAFARSIGNPFKKKKKEEKKDDGKKKKKKDDDHH